MQFSLWWSVKKDEKAFKKHLTWIVYYIASRDWQYFRYMDLKKKIFSYHLSVLVNERLGSSVLQVVIIIY